MWIFYFFKLTLFKMYFKNMIFFSLTLASLTTIFLNILNLISETIPLGIETAARVLRANRWRTDYSYYILNNL